MLILWDNNSFGSLENNSIIGFLGGTYTRESDGLPITGTILFDTNKFRKQLLSGEAGTLDNKGTFLRCQFGLFRVNSQS